MSEEEEVLWMGGCGRRRVIRYGWGIQAQYFGEDGWDGAVGDGEQDIYEACIEALYRDKHTPTTPDVAHSHWHEHNRKRYEMLEWLTKAHLSRLEDWRLVEERSADGMRTTWHFEKNTPDNPVG